MIRSLHHRTRMLIAILLMTVGMMMILTLDDVLMLAGLFLVCPSWVWLVMSTFKIRGYQ